jgi:CheY-like chemotaxis protein
MILAGRPAKILLIDTNVYFSKRLSDALKREGFEVTCSTQPSFALTTLEYDPPTAIVCSTNMREMGALDIARLVRADAKSASLPVIALGDGSQRALMEAFQAGCDDYIDRSRPPAVIATHVRNIIISKAEGFQPTQMLPQADTSLSGSLTHHDLPGVMQMLGHAHQTGALHINSGDTDALLFFDAGEIAHAECGALFGDEAVIHILQSCMRNNSGVYKFVYASSSAKRTVLRSATDLMLDAMREMDESAHASQEPLVQPPGAARQDSSFASVLGVADLPSTTTCEESSAIAAAIDNFATSSGSTDFSLCSSGPEFSQPGNVSAEPEPAEQLRPEHLESNYVFETPAAGAPSADVLPEALSQAPVAECPGKSFSSRAEPSFANYSIVPYAGNDIEDIT